jgi:hypothetical protein
MGNRSNVYFKQVAEGFDSEGNAVSIDSGIYMYCHLDGERIAQKVHLALSRRKRWDDDSYLARILFQTILDGDTDTIGYGLSLSQTDSENNVLVVDVDKQYVALSNFPYDQMEFNKVSFEDFVSMSEKEAVKWFCSRI